MAATTVHGRIKKRHPELDEEDILAAWDAAIMSMPRLPDRPDEYVVLGFDGKGRLLEIVGVRGEKGEWLIFHATTPPSDKTFREFRIAR